MTTRGHFSLLSSSSCLLLSLYPTITDLLVYGGSQTMGRGNCSCSCTLMFLGLLHVASAAGFTDESIPLWGHEASWGSDQEGAQLCSIHAPPVPSPKSLPVP